MTIKVHSKILLPDTSCLIVLDKIGRLPLLNEMASEVITTRIIEQEFLSQLPKWMIVIDPEKDPLQIHPEFMLDRGETSLLSIYPKIENGILVLDDLKARKVAKILKYKVTGTIGLLLAAKELKLIETLKFELEQIQAKGFYIDEELVRSLLITAGELSNDL